MDYPFDVGPSSREVTAANAQAQTWFDRGLNWLYGYSHEEAITCFTEATKADPTCAMAWWGISYAAGPNYNLPWHLYDPAGKAAALGAAYDAMQEAMKHAAGTTAVEQAMIQALGARYQAREPVDDMRPWDKAFTAAMREVFAAHKADREVRTVFVEAIMNETPWKMWDLATGGVAEGAGTEEAMAVLDEAFASDPDAWDHPGLLHLHVHLMEMSPFPEKALRTGDRLRQIAPDLGHLIHMPTHIDVLCGHYHNVLHWNQKAIEADRKFLAARGPLNVYALYRTHNHHFAIYGAMFLGQYTPALAAAQELIDTTPEEVLRIESPPMADFTEGYFPMKQHVLVRFGKWEDIIAQEEPEDKELYCSTVSMMRYAKAVAYSALGRVEEAEAAREAFLEAKAAQKESRLVHNNTVSDLLEIAHAMLEGELEYRKGNFDVAFEHLRRSVALDDALPYDEPWGWMQPARHALGALLMEQGRYEEAEAVYRADLGLDGTLSRACIHPENVWSLKGLHECLVRRGETVEAAHIKPRLDLAAARAEMPVKASCFCSQVAMAAE
ncbi:MAG: tetratricopeptide repeat protein [Pseudomonadota bacterium]